MKDDLAARDPTVILNELYAVYRFRECHWEWQVHNQMENKTHGWPPHKPKPEQESPEPMQIGVNAFYSRWSRRPSSHEGPCLACGQTARWHAPSSQCPLKAREALQDGGPVMSPKLGSHVIGLPIPATLRWESGLVAIVSVFK